MKEIVFISGKGGTGKTSLAASFSQIIADKSVVADCDVDASDLHLLLKPENYSEEVFFSGELAVIDESICTQCGKCIEICRFNAIEIINEKHYINKISCEGCGYCIKICPEEAISNIPNSVGLTYKAVNKFNTPMVYAKLDIGADNSGKLVAKVKNEAKKIAESNSKEYLIIDGSPGIGCPVVSSLSGADLVVIVSEASLSGLHDLKRVYELVNKFKITAVCIINKYDINIEITNKIKEFLRENQIKHILDIPYNQDFTHAMTFGKTLIEYNIEFSSMLNSAWNNINN